MQLASPAFAPGQPIPPLFTCKGKDVSPPLSVSLVPAGAVALAMIMDDPDAPVGLWTHWTWWDLPAGAALIQGVDIAKLGGAEGVTTAKTVGYHGPCPPSGTHRYFFRLYALSSRLGLRRGASRGDLEAALKGNAVAEATLMGTFTKS